MEERDWYTYDVEKKVHVFNQYSIYTLYLSIDHFEWLHDKHNNIPNGYFRPIVETLNKDEIVVCFAYHTDGRLEPATPKMRKE